MTRVNYHERQEARRKHLEERAEKALQKADASERAAEERSRLIPLGQPILVGHHSEKRHRRDLARIEQGFRTANAERDKARKLVRRAESVGSAGIASDDPEALELLTEKISRLEALQATRKEFNAAWRRAGSPAPDDSAAWAKLSTALGRSQADVNEVRLEMARCWGWQPNTAPFPGYALSNTSAEIRRLKERIAGLSRAQTAEEVTENHGCCRLVESPEENRVRLIFEAKPEEQVRALLKRFGFRWSPSALAWQRHLNDAGRAAARAVLEELRSDAKL